MYGPYLSSLHKDVWEEAKSMARSKKKTIEDFFDLRPLLKTVGVEKFMEAMDGEDVDKVIKKIGIEEILDHLSPEQLRQLKESVAKRG